MELASRADGFGVGDKSANFLAKALSIGKPPNCNIRVFGTSMGNVQQSYLVVD